MLGFQFNPINGAICPVCGKSDVRDAVNIPIVPEKEEDEINYIQVHLNCLTEGLSLAPSEEGSIIGKPAPYYTLVAEELER